MLSCLGKLFLTILHNRLLKFVAEKKLLTTNQLGFIKGSRTSDAHVILDNLIDEYCQKNNKYIYSCFVDFEKAFDTIPRDLLFKKLFNMGITGNFFNILKQLYIDDKASLKMQNYISKPFPTNQGVRQGRVLSPLLFNLYMADFTEEINKCADKVKISDDVDAG